MFRIIESVIALAVLGALALHGAAALLRALRRYLDRSVAPPEVATDVDALGRRVHGRTRGERWTPPRWIRFPRAVELEAPSDSSDLGGGDSPTLPMELPSSRRLPILEGPTKLMVRRAPRGPLVEATPSGPRGRLRIPYADTDVDPPPSDAVEP